MNVDAWTLSDITDACSLKPEKKRKLQIPKFQRRRVWTPDKEDELIETLKSGNISIGVLQLWKIGAIGKLDNYLLVDGLHRTSTLTKYYNDPFTFGRSKKLITEIVKSIVDKYQTYKTEDIEICCAKWFNKEMLGTYEEFADSEDYTKKIKELKEFVQTVSDKKDKDSMAQFIMDKTKELAKNMNISKSIIPVILNTGTLDDLAILFKRINQNGTPLSLCDVLAAVWINSKIKIKNKEIIECIADHYKDLKQENNNMDIYMINDDDKTFTVYEYMIGLKRYLAKKYEDTFFGLIKDKEFIFKLVACCYYEDTGKKSIEKLNTTLVNEDLTELEQKLEWAIKFISKTFDKIVIFDKKLIVREVPIFLAMLSLVFGNKNKISKREDYYSDMFIVNILSDKLSDTNFNTKIIKLVVAEERYMKKIYKAEFIEKINRYITEGTKLFGKNDRAPSSTTKIILTVLNKIHNEPDIEVKFGNIIPKKTIVEKDKKLTQPINCLGNVCLYNIGERDRKPTQTIVNYLNGNDVSDTDIEDTVTFMNGETKYDDILMKTSDFDKTKYHDFLKFRGKKIKELLLDAYKANMKDDSDDESDSDSNDSDSESESESNSDNNTVDDNVSDNSESEDEKPIKKSKAIVVDKKKNVDKKLKDLDNSDSEDERLVKKPKAKPAKVKPNKKSDSDSEDDKNDNSSEDEKIIDKKSNKQKKTSDKSYKSDKSNETNKKIIKTVGNRTSIKVVLD